MNLQFPTVPRPAVDQTSEIGVWAQAKPGRGFCGGITPCSHSYSGWTAGRDQGISKTALCVFQLDPIDCLVCNPFVTDSLVVQR